MRGEELTKAKLCDLDLSRSTIKIRAAKGSNDREVPIKKPCLERLFTELSKGPLYGTDKPASLKARLRVELKRALVNSIGIGFSGLSLHSLRASFAIQMYNKMGHDILLVKELLGHKSIDSTMHYVNVSRLNDNKTKILKAIG